MTSPAASGIFKQVRYGAESTWNTAVASGGTSYQLRRVASTLSPDIAAFRSNEIQPDRQVHTFRHGTQMIRGALRGELSPLTYKDFFGALWGGAWTAGHSETITTGTNTLTWTAGPPGTLARTSGSWLSGGGFKKGDGVRVTGSSVTANNSRNLRIVALSATTMTFGGSDNEVISSGSD